MADLPCISEKSLPFLEVLKSLAAAKSAAMRMHGLYGSARVLLVYSLYRHAPQLLKHIFLCETEEDIQYLRNDLLGFFPQNVVCVYPCGTSLTSAEQLEKSLALEALFGDQHAYVILLRKGLESQVRRKYRLSRKKVTLRCTQTIQREDITDILSEWSFVATEEVLEPGTYRMQGGRIDIFSYAHAAPFRLTLWGDKIEKISFFAVEDQLSYAEAEQVELLGAPNTTDTYTQTQSLYAALPSSCCVWHMGMHLVEQAAYDFTKFSQLYFSHAPKGAKDIKWQGAPQPPLQNFQEIALHLQNFQEKGYSLLLSAAQQVHAYRLKEVLFREAENLSIRILPFPLQAGFVLHDEQLLCYTDHELVGRVYVPKHSPVECNVGRLTLKELEDLQVGDFVTHVDYGIGRFAGLHVLEKEDRKQEMLRIVFKDNDILYVHVRSLYKLSKYRQATVAPKLSKLGSTAWTKKKTRIKEKMTHLVKDLVKLYAQRKSLAGFAFPKDPFIEASMISSFMYEDTPDQAEATCAVMQDMEAPYPMDRLICGDVGFGKTEIAMRAACKAVRGGKQVAVLVPTTVLAMQHHKSFTERLASFAIEVGILHRFCPEKERKVTLQKIETGKIEVIIGTAALLSEKIKFFDLGLLVIDEEQKFGVAIKERLKKKYMSVDVLSMTATPIPRTLHFSLIGARDISLIHTPPPNRRAIHTTLQVFRSEHIKQALTMELARGGQAFFVHRNIGYLLKIHSILKEILPEARIAVIHGKMKGTYLEKTLVNFVNGNYDILISTNIIENGLDIPNANTIIVQDAQFFGLADLHQMRGRVGRSNMKAYCYLLTPPLESLSLEARKRLSAIEAFSQLGDGYKIARRDLDIRGAGNLLGHEQSGFINELGLETYQKLLEEAVDTITPDQQALLRSNSTLRFKTCALDTDVALYLPKEYISGTQQRLSCYKRLSEIKDISDLEAYKRELEDRFGELPLSARDLVESVALSIYGAAYGFEKITLKRTTLKLFFKKGNMHFLQSDFFQHMLNFLKEQPELSKLEEKQAFGCLILFKVRSIAEAVPRLTNIESQEQLKK